MVLASQPAGDGSHKPGGRLTLLSARPAVTSPSAAEHHTPPFGRHQAILMNDLPRVAAPSRESKLHPDDRKSSTLIKHATEPHNMHRPSLDARNSVRRVPVSLDVQR